MVYDPYVNVDLRVSPSTTFNQHLRGMVANGVEMLPTVADEMFQLHHRGLSAPRAKRSAGEVFGRHGISMAGIGPLLN